MAGKILIICTKKARFLMLSDKDFSQRCPDTMLHNGQSLGLL